MQVRKLAGELSIAPQIEVADVEQIARLGYKSIICNRPDGEDAGQPSFVEIARAAKKAGLETMYFPVTPGAIADEDGAAFGEMFEALPKPVVAYCKSGNRSSTLWTLWRAGQLPREANSMGESVEGILSSSQASPDAMGDRAKETGNHGRAQMRAAHHDIIIVGGGSAGVSCAASLLARKGDLDIAIIEPSDTHYYQPGWTLVGGGVFRAEQTAKPMGRVMPSKVTWIKDSVIEFNPGDDCVVLGDGRRVTYNRLIVCPGLKLDWEGVEGLSDTLGQNGVTSNYRYDLAPYTWQLVQALKTGIAVFTQPPMPIKCAGAPQKAMYLSADHWRRKGRLDDIDVGFYNAGGVLFGVAEYVPALMEYVERYKINLNFNCKLVAIDGPGHMARFVETLKDGSSRTVETHFDMIHVCPPQTAPDFIRRSALSDQDGWVDVDTGTLRHKTYDNVYGLGDVTNTPNAKTAAAARKQAPIVAVNVLFDMGVHKTRSIYDGYGSCPLTVERGKIVLAEFGYGGKIMPSLPKFVVDGMRPTRRAWFLKERLLPLIYWRGMLKGREWLVKPKPEEIR